MQEARIGSGRFCPVLVLIAAVLASEPTSEVFGWATGFMNVAFAPASCIALIRPRLMEVAPASLLTG